MRLFVGLFLILLLTGQAATAETKGRFLGGIATEYPAWFKSSFLNLAEEVADARAHHKRLMVIFHQDNCPYCNALVERNFSQQSIESYTRKHFDALAINMWGDREVTTLDGQILSEKDFAAALKVQFTPTILFFDEAGKIILRLNGYLPPARFQTALEFVAQHKEKESSYREYAARHEPAPAKGELHHEDFFRPPPFDLTRKGPNARPVAAFFEQKDCPGCDTLHRQVLSDRDTRTLIARFDAIQLDMWSATPVTTPQGKRTTAREWAKALDVKYAPTIVLFDPSGKEIIRSEAFFKVFHTQGIFDYVSSGAYRTESSFQRYLSAHAEHLREQGKDVDIWRLADEPAK